MLTANVMLIFYINVCCCFLGTTVQGFSLVLQYGDFSLGIAIGAEYPTSSVIASNLLTNYLPVIEIDISVGSPML